MKIINTSVNTKIAKARTRKAKFEVSKKKRIYKAEKQSYQNELVKDIKKGLIYRGKQLLVILAVIYVASVIWKGRYNYFTSTYEIKSHIYHANEEINEEIDTCGLVDVVCPAEASELPKVEESQPQTAKVTAYNSVEGQTDASPCIGADGTNLCEYKGCAVAMNGVKLGTKINLDTFGVCTVKDRKNARYDSTWVDVYFGGADKVAEARKFGVKNLSYTVIK